MFPLPKVFFNNYPDKQYPIYITNQQYKHIYQYILNNSDIKHKLILLQKLFKYRNVGYSIDRNIIKSNTTYYKNYTYMILLRYVEGMIDIYKIEWDNSTNDIQKIIKLYEQLSDKLNITIRIRYNFNIYYMLNIANKIASITTSTKYNNKLIKIFLDKNIFKILAHIIISGIHNNITNDDLIRLYSFYKDFILHFGIYPYNVDIDIIYKYGIRQRKHKYPLRNTNIIDLLVEITHTENQVEKILSKYSITSQEINNFYYDIIYSNLKK